MVVKKTSFIDILEAIHNTTDMRYGQIINNALQLEYGRKENLAEYDTFNISDEKFTKILLKFKNKIELKGELNEDK